MKSKWIHGDLVGVQGDIDEGPTHIPGRVIR